MVNAAPAEIKKDTQTVQAAMKTLQGVFEKAGYDMAKLASDPEAIKELEVVSSDEVTTASDNITTYLDDTCGITPTT